MDQCRKVREQLTDNLRKRSSVGEPAGASELNRHLEDCPSCRLFWRNLQAVGRRLNDFGDWAEQGMPVPEITYFENLVRDVTAGHRVQSETGIGNRFRVGEVLAFMGLGLLILTGAGVAVHYGYLLPVGLVFGLTAMQAPLLILLRMREQEGGEIADEA
jgi:predicted anti-sigma-YlaC factor YlaD